MIYPDLTLQLRVTGAGAESVVMKAKNGKIEIFCSAQSAMKKVAPVPDFWI